MATSRLGKDVVDLLDAGVVYPDPESATGTRTVLKDIEWQIAPGERTGILGVNGAGKSTLLGLVTGTVTPTSGPGQARHDRAYREPHPATRRTHRV